MPTLVDNSTKREGSCRLASRSGTPVFEETYSYLVKADYIGQSNAEIITCTGLPIINTTTSAGGYAICKSLSATRRENAVLYYDVTADFSSEVEENQGSDANNPSQDPTTWVPVYETKFERLQEVVTKDAAGATIANSAGQAFEVGLTRSRFLPIWEFYQFEAASVTDETIIERNEVVNGSTFRGRAAKTLLCTVLSSVLGFYYGQRRRLTQYQLKYNKDDWRHKRQDTGTQYKSGTTLLDFTSLDGSIMLGSLDGSGGKQAAGTKPSVLNFDIYATNSFSFIRV